MLEFAWVSSTATHFDRTKVPINQEERAFWMSAVLSLHFLQGSKRNALAPLRNAVVARTFGAFDLPAIIAFLERVRMTCEAWGTTDATYTCAGGLTKARHGSH